MYDLWMNQVSTLAQRPPRKVRLATAEQLLWFNALIAQAAYGTGPWQPEQQALKSRPNEKT